MDQAYPLSLDSPKVVKGVTSPKYPQGISVELSQVKSVLWHVGVGTQQRHIDPDKHLGKTDLPNG